MKLHNKILFGLFAILFIYIPGTAFAEESLSEGKQGQAVLHLQENLKKLGYFADQATGYYGPVTKNAVKQFQQDTGISPTGFVGPLTQQKLNDIEMMAKVVHGEARGESYEGKVAVAAVILNRLESPEFPGSTHDVIFQSNAFTAVYDGQYDLSPAGYAYQAVMDAMKGWDPTHGSVYYYNPEIATDDWIFTREAVINIGNHLFAK
ncbi:cell wall hydrolase [Aciduricibacillus chroicocephali]|uniref:Cell wall hydrolase n=1 Tax=Aciduricibacillus chroicocephali TaxID=3054939 RepID=A0ABY9KS72_9BACI|nr:cell wall hydrolase [Bacillaceae bacterium 44XB]